MRYWRKMAGPSESKRIAKLIKEKIGQSNNKLTKATVKSKKRLVVEFDQPFSVSVSASYRGVSLCGSSVFVTCFSTRDDRYKLGLSISNKSSSITSRLFFSSIKLATHFQRSLCDVNKLFGFLIGHENIQPTGVCIVPNRIDLSPIEPHWKLPFLLRGAYTLCEVEELSREVSFLCARRIPCTWWMIDSKGKSLHVT